MTTSIREQQIKNRRYNASSNNPFVGSSATLKRATVAEKKAEKLEQTLKKQKEKEKIRKSQPAAQPLSKEAIEFVASKLTPRSSEQDKKRYGYITKICEFYEKFQVAPSNRKSLAQLGKMKLDQLEAEYRGLEHRRASSMSVRLVRLGWSWLTRTVAKGLADMSQNEEVSEMLGGFELHAEFIDHVVDYALENDQELNDDLMEFAIKYSGLLELAVHWRLLIHSGSYIAQAHSMAEEEKRERQYKKYSKK